MVTPPTKPKAVHVYRGTVTGNLSVYEKRLPKRELGYRERLGEYVPRGPVLSERWEVRSPHLSSRTFVSHDDARGHAKYQRCSGLSARIVHITVRKAAK